MKQESMVQIFWINCQLIVLLASLLTVCCVSCWITIYSSSPNSPVRSHYVTKLLRRRSDELCDATFCCDRALRAQWKTVDKLTVIYVADFTHLKPLVYTLGMELVITGQDP